MRLERKKATPMILKSVAQNFARVTRALTNRDMLKFARAVFEMKSIRHVFQGLPDLPDVFDEFIAGRAHGRVVVSINPEP